MAPSSTIRQPSPSTGVSIFFITVGVLLAIWSAVWYYYLGQSEAPVPQWKYFVCTGLFLSGLALLTIGILVGRIGREAQNADVPVGQVGPTASAPVAPAAPVVTPAQPAPLSRSGPVT